MLRWMRSGSASWLLATASLGVCFAQPGDPVLGAAAKVLTLAGQVSVLKDSQPWALVEGDTVLPRQVVITGPDGFAVFKVSDGSTFEVFSNSRVTFRDNADWRDLLDMWIGRVKVHIQKLGGGQPNNNRVRTPTAVISVRGTIFDVQVEDEDSTTLVMVEEGQVAVQHTLLPRGEPKLLNQGEWLRVYKNQPLAQRSVDKESIIRTALRAMADALYTTVYRSPQSGPGGPSAPPPVGGGGTGPLPGDHGSKDPTPPPPPPAPSAGGGTAGAPPPPPPPTN